VIEDGVTIQRRPLLPHEDFDAKYEGEWNMDTN
jgi:hypothetical protein